MTPRLATRPRSGQPGSRLPTARIGRAVLLAVLLVSGLVLTSAALDDPPFVPRVAIDNPSPHDIAVTVSSPEAAGELPLGTARQRCTTSFHEIVDQGDAWVVRFQAQGVDGGAISLSRDALQQAGWTIRVPDEVVARLTAAGAPLPPVHGCPTG